MATTRSRWRRRQEQDLEHLGFDVHRTARRDAAPGAAGPARMPSKRYTETRPPSLRTQCQPAPSGPTRLRGLQNSLRAISTSSPRPRRCHGPTVDPARPSGGEGGEIEMERVRSMGEQAKQNASRGARGPASAAWSRPGCWRTPSTRSPWWSATSSPVGGGDDAAYLRDVMCMVCRPEVCRFFERLFPGLRAELAADGAREVDDLSRPWVRLRWAAAEPRGVRHRSGALRRRARTWSGGCGNGYDGCPVSGLPTASRRSGSPPWGARSRAPSCDRRARDPRGHSGRPGAHHRRGPRGRRDRTRKPDASLAPR